jgi:hypothetical protein
MGSCVLTTTKFLSLAVLGIGLAVASGASAQSIGGHDETSEQNATGWATGTPTPGTAPAGSAGHLLVTEIVVTPTAAEFFEIHNPTSESIDLTDYYVSDAWAQPAGLDPVGYHLLPSGTLVIGSNTDFVVRFPSGATIAPGETQVIALYGPGVDSTYGAGTADYEVTSVSGTIPDMINVGGVAASANTTTLTNGSEFIVLFRWNGTTDNVCDVDYVTWGTSSGTSRVDKSGIVVDGPDGDAVGTPYLPDTPIATQSSVPAPAFGTSVARGSATESVEALAGGNGCVDVATSSKSSTWGNLKARYR